MGKVHGSLARAGKVKQQVSSRHPQREKLCIGQTSNIETASESVKGQKEGWGDLERSAVVRGRYLGADGDGDGDGHGHGHGI